MSERGTGFSNVASLLRQWTGDGVLPGAAVCVAQGGRVRWEGAAGFARREPPADARTDQIWATASISKPVAAAAVLQLVDAGELELDQPVCDIVPEFAPARDHIRIRHLLTHTSGMSDAWPAEEVFRQRGLAGALATVPLLFHPGRGCAYSTTAFTLLDAIVQRTTGLAWADYTRTRIFEPLGMGDSSFAPPASWSPRIPAVYDAYERVDSWWSYPASRRSGGPGGGMYSTLRDLAIFGQAFLDLDERLLSGESYAQMTRLQTPGLPDSSGRRQSWGLGWYLYCDERSFNGFCDLLSPRAYGHGGATGTWLGIDPGRSLVIVLLTNRLGLELATASALQERLVRETLRALSATA